jgi:predicted metal-dependent hydrolase
MANDASSTLPPYTIRRSARARHARLVLSPRDGLVVVVPERFDTTRIPALIAARAAWIERAALRLGGVPLAPTRPAVPDEIALGAIQRRFRVDTADANPSRARVEEHGDCLVVFPGPGGDDDALEALRSWLSARAEGMLVPRLGRLALAQGVSIGRVTIRAQRTRWASCSARGDISLNRALLFLSPELVDHVLYHELSHRYELNHSPRFRERLLAMDPRTPEHEAALRGAWKVVPPWAG